MRSVAEASWQCHCYGCSSDTVLASPHASHGHDQGSF